MKFSSLIPKSLRKIFRETVKRKYGYFEDPNSYNYFYSAFLDRRKAIEEEIPRIDLEAKHIQNLKVLVDRKELLKCMPQNATCSELGVNEGDFSEQILQFTTPRKLHLIDAWGDETRYHDGLKIKVQDKFSEDLETGTVEVNIGFSTDILKTFSNHYFDWVYLDTDHTYKVTAAELNILKDKVKPNGIIAGHDYIIGNWVGDCRYGVIEAVNELCVKDNWELIYITINKNEMPSFAIRRI